jgi:hypothetical protein
MASTYAYLGRALYPNSDSSRWLWVPHSASSRFQRRVNATARTDVALMTGSAGATYYPYRAQAAKLQSVHVLPHPGYEWQRTQAQHLAFVAEAASYAVGLTSGLTLNYAVAKFFEIPAMGQLLLANSEMEPFLRFLGYVPHVHYLLYSAAHMDTVVSLALATHHLHVRHTGQALIKSLHTTAHRAAQLNAMARCVATVARRAVWECRVWTWQTS